MIASLIILTFLALCCAPVGKATGLLAETPSAGSRRVSPPSDTAALIEGAR